MAKNKRLTIRLDDELSTTIEQACQDGKCDKTTVVINALKEGLGMVQDQLAKVAEPQKEIVQGRIRVGNSENIPKATITEIIEDDGTRHQVKNGKIIACKRPGKNWRYFLEV